MMTKKKKPKPKYNLTDPPQYEIWWMDAIANAEWFRPNQIEEWVEDIANPIKQVGYVLRKDNDCVVFASRIHADKDDNIFSIGGLQWIPKAWIVKMIEIKE